MQPEHVIVDADRVELDQPLDGAEHVEHSGGSGGGVSVSSQLDVGAALRFLTPGRAPMQPPPLKVPSYLLDNLIAIPPKCPLFSLFLLHPSRHLHTSPLSAQERIATTTDTSE